MLGCRSSINIQLRPKPRALEPDCAPFQDLYENGYEIWPQPIFFTSRAFERFDLQLQ